MHHTETRDLCVGLPRECKCFAFLLRKPADWWGGRETRERRRRWKKEGKERGDIIGGRFPPIFPTLS